LAIVNNSITSTMAEEESSVASTNLSKCQKKRKRKHRLAAAAANEQREQNEQSNLDNEQVAQLTANNDERQAEIAAAAVDEQREKNEPTNQDNEQFVAQLTARNDEIVELKLLLEEAEHKSILCQLDIERLQGSLDMADRYSFKHESSKFRAEEKLAASEARIVKLQLTLEQTKQTSQSIIDELVSSKEQVLAELAESQAQAVLLEARLALITDEVPSNSTKADDNFAKIQGKEGTINKFKVWRDRQRGTRDKIEVDYTSCRYGQMQTDIIEIGPHEDETQLQAIIRELNDLSQKHPQRDVRSRKYLLKFTSFCLRLNNWRLTMALVFAGIHSRILSS
jgi:hypothetical protein